MVFDTMVDIQRSHNLGSYSLNAVSQHFLTTKLPKQPLSCEEGSRELRIIHPGHGFCEQDVVRLFDVDTPDVMESDDGYYYAWGGWTFEELHGDGQPSVPLLRKKLEVSRLTPLAHREENIFAQWAEIDAARANYEAVVLKREERDWDCKHLQKGPIGTRIGATSEDCCEQSTTPNPLGRRCCNSDQRQTSLPRAQSLDHSLGQSKQMDLRYNCKTLDQWLL
jgi:hypothetical protein